MPSFNTHVLPTSSGLNLGSSNQLWNLWANLINGAVPANFSVVSVPFSSTPTFTTTSLITVFNMTLIGNVTGGTLVASVPGLIIFQIAQDATGGRSFVWPANFNSSIAPDATASTTTTQIFYNDGVNVWPCGPGSVYP